MSSNSQKTSRRLPSFDTEELRLMVKNSMLKRKQAFVFGLAKNIFKRLDQTSLSVPNRIVDEEPWVEIGSLSQLRAEVGGRFAKLKERWVGAGFPLREHRGDRAGKAKLNNEGWLALVMWMNKQGFEAELGGSEEKWLFRVKSLLDNNSK